MCRKTNSWFGKSHEEFGKFLAVVIIGALMKSSYPKQKTYELKIYGEVMCQNNEEWCDV